jgi:hypothetical protein
MRLIRRFSPKLSRHDPHFSAPSRGHPLLTGGRAHPGPAPPLRPTRGCHFLLDRGFIMSKKAPMACAGAFAAAATIAGSAFAAEPAPTPPPPAPIFTWTGLYVGGQMGYTWGHDPVTWSGISNNDELAGGTFSHTPQGAIGGAHVGYNLQYNQWAVLGLEGSVDGTSLSKLSCGACE